MSKAEGKTFEAVVQEEGSFIFVAIPFSPRQVWGAKPRYHVAGSINGQKVRGTLGALGQEYFLRLSKTWIRENNIRSGMSVTVKLLPEVRN